MTSSIMNTVSSRIWIKGIKCHDGDGWVEFASVCDERPKSPIEKRKRNLKLFSPISRGEGEI